MSAQQAPHDEWLAQGLQALRARPIETLRAQLTTCCGAARWVDRMLARHPFADVSTMLRDAESIWWDLDESDWLQAFAAHPKIGDVESIRRKYAAQATWSLQEQTGVRGASEAVLQGLAAGNAAYEAKFGFIFLVCATGKSAAELLAILTARLPADRASELRVAAGEQAKITALRLRKWLTEAAQATETGDPSR